MAQPCAACQHLLQLTQCVSRSMWFTYKRVALMRILRIQFEARLYMHVRLSAQLPPLLVRQHLGGLPLQLEAATAPAGAEQAQKCAWTQTGWSFLAVPWVEMSAASVPTKVGARHPALGLESFLETRCLAIAPLTARFPMASPPQGLVAFVVAALVQQPHLQPIRLLVKNLCQTRSTFQSHPSQLEVCSAVGPKQQRT